MLKSRIIIFCSLLLLFACDNTTADLNRTENDGPNLPGATGKLGELIIVAPESQWKGAIGDAIVEAFENYYPVLPQYEPRLNLKHQTWDLYKKYYIRHRNVLIVNVEEVVQNREVRTIRHSKVNSRGQLIYEIVCRTEAEFAEELKKSATRIINEIEEAEIKREYKNISKKRNRPAETELSKDHNIELTLPKIFSISENKKDFVWIQGPSYTGKKGATQEGILIYYTDYASDSLFDEDIIMQRRDTVLKKYVPGPEIGSYMSTQYHPDYAPEHRITEINGRYSHEVKGIWRIKDGTSMAGPFVSVTTVDEERNRFVTIEGYVYAPGENKKPLIRRMEAIIKTMNFTKGPEEQPEEMKAKL